ncbi:hypothetical protein F5Y18DRAFT_186254 [Xylariaceae sp. FL1019]|nr:hypothetical protein F5Y18DRAFT_186254 [Xylariaceae sp. FL1019]
MQELPFVEVRDLPPSASFYSAISQPLGLRFISADSSNIVFGDTSSTPPIPVFQVRVAASDVGAQPPKRTRLVLSAESPAVVSAFHAAARRASSDISARDNFLRIQDAAGPAGGESRARVTDLEGNTMEVVYVNPPGYPSRYEGSTVRRTQSTDKEVSRILDWNLDVATSVTPRPTTRSVAPSRRIIDGVEIPEEGPFQYMRRTVTMSTIETPQSEPQSTSKGLSTGAMVGTVLGAVAAGAAVGAGITYALSRNDRKKAPRQEFDMPPMQRRATYPDPYPNHHPRYVEVERTVEKIHFPDQYPPLSKKYPPPAYMTRYSQVGGPAASRAPDDLNDERARSHYTTGTRTRDRNETRRPLMITNAEHRSNVGSQYSETPRYIMEAEPSIAPSRHSNARSKVLPEAADGRSRAPSKVYSQAPARSHASSRLSKHDDSGRSHVSSRHSRVRDSDNDTYISARSEKSASTVRPVQSKAPTHYSSVTIKPEGKSRSPTYVSVRDALPLSRAGDDSDDTGSVAPSDSISCIGSKHHHRKC